MTEAAVGAGVSTVLLLCALYLTGGTEAKPLHRPLLPLALAVAVAAVVEPVRLVGAVCVRDLDVIALVASHHLVARHTVRHRVHDGPLRRGVVPAALGFFQRKLDHASTSEIRPLKAPNAITV